MDRPHALAPSNEELMSVAYNEGTLPAEERAHLEQCSICQQRLAIYMRTNALLRAKLYRRLCPSAVDLNYYCLGMVPEERRISIASHLLDCPLCADEVAEIRTLQAAFDPFPPAMPSLGAGMRRIFANLVVSQAQLVTRSNLPGTGWPRQYRAEAIDLSLHLSRAGKREMVLLGIISSTDPGEQLGAFEKVTAELYALPGPLLVAHEGDQSNERTVTPLLSTQVDKLGNIVFRPVPMGEYVMIIHLPDRDIVIEGLTVEHERGYA